MRIRATLPIALLVAAPLLSCSGSDSVAPPDDGTVTINMTIGLRFQPNDITIDPGTTVRWVNDAIVLHTITPDDAGQPGVWSRVSTSQTGVVLTHTFNEPGQTYTYFCEPHLADGMTGVIRVRSQ